MHLREQTPRRSVAGVCLSGVGLGLPIPWNTVSLLLGKRKSGGAMGGRWEIPGGKVEDGESDHLALERELDEEFSLDVCIGPLLTQAGFLHKGREFVVYAYQVMLPADPVRTPEHSRVDRLPLAAALSLELVDSDRSLIENLLTTEPVVISAFTQ